MQAVRKSGEPDMTERWLEKTLKKVEKTFKKGIDKPKVLWYNNKVAAKTRWRK